MKNYRKQFGAVMLVVLAGGVARADVTIDTTPDWNGSRGVYDFGVPNTATYGQTITAPSSPNTVLKSFTFQINDLGSTQSLIGYVYQWNATTHMAEGPALYQSSVVSLGASDSYQAVQFNTGGVNLIAGNQYVMFGSVSDPSIYNQGDSASEWGSILSNPTGGSFVFINNGNDPSKWTSAAWRVGYPSATELAFTADFGSSVAAVPEPSSLAVAGPIILISLGYFRARGKRAAVA